VSAVEHEDDARWIELTPVGYAVGESPIVDEHGPQAVVVAAPAVRRVRPARARHGPRFSSRRVRTPLAAAGVAAAIAAAYALGAGSVSAPNVPVAMGLHARGRAGLQASRLAAPGAVQPVAHAMPRARRIPRRRPATRFAARHGAPVVVADGTQAALTRAAARRPGRVGVSYSAVSPAREPAAHGSPRAPVRHAYSPPATLPTYSPPAAVAAKVARSQTPPSQTSAAVPHPYVTVSSGPSCYPGQLGC
jgi:hypothetical protein